VLHSPPAGWHGYKAVALSGLLGGKHSRTCQARAIGVGGVSVPAFEGSSSLYFHSGAQGEPHFLCSLLQVYWCMHIARLQDQEGLKSLSNLEALELSTEAVNKRQQEHCGSCSSLKPPHPSEFVLSTSRINDAATSIK